MRLWDRGFPNANTAAAVEPLITPDHNVLAGLTVARALLLLQRNTRRAAGVLDERLTTVREAK